MDSTSKFQLLANLVEPFHASAENIPILVTASADEVNTWVQSEIIEKKVTCIGIDAEWKPVAKGEMPRVAVVQVATIHSVLVFQIIHATDSLLDGAFFQVMQDPSVYKVSVEILHDSLLISQQFQINILGRIDLGIMDTDDLLGRRLGLKQLTKKYLGKEIPKPKEIQCSAWNELELTSEQVIYAALDAWICVPIFEEARKSCAFEADDLTPEEGLVKWKKWKYHEKKRRKWVKKRDAMPIHAEFTVPEHVQNASLWKEFQTNYVDRKSRMSSQFGGGILEISESGSLLVHAKDESTPKSVEQSLSTLIMLILEEEEHGEALPFTVEAATKGSRRCSQFVLDYKGTRQQKRKNNRKTGPDMKSEEMHLHVKIELFAKWSRQRRNRNQEALANEEEVKSECKAEENPPPLDDITNGAISQEERIEQMQFAAKEDRDFSLGWYDVCNLPDLE